MRLDIGLDFGLDVLLAFGLDSGSEFKLEFELDSKYICIWIPDRVWDRNQNAILNLIWD